MLDRTEILVQAGSGGNGCISFRREKYVPRGGPDGGNGGRGASVIVFASDSVSTLIDQHYTKHYDGDRGGHGLGKACDGADAPDRRVMVPPGTIVHDADTGAMLADLDHPGAEVVVAAGGIGGRGNASFKSSTYQAPRVAENGEPGEERRIRLEVKLIADVGLVGFPNAGKSTLLSIMSDAKPKIAEYPFTTLEPQLGICRVESEQSFVLADLPGLIEGAHEGAGLGRDFLRHVERTRLLLHVVDAACVDGRDAIEDMRVINRELRLYDSHLAELPQLIVLNKLDLPDAQDRLESLRRKLGGRPVFETSAATGVGIRELAAAAYAYVADIRRREQIQASDSAVEPVVYWRRGGIKVAREGDAFRVDSDAVRRAVVMTDLDNDEAVWLLTRRLRRMGLERALRRAGAADGDTILIGDVELVFTTGRQPGSFAEFLATRHPAARRQDRDEHPHRRRASAR